MSAPPLDAPAGREPASSPDFRADALLAAGLLVAAIVSTALNAASGIYGLEAPEMHWTLLYAAGLTVPLAFRRRAPEIVAVIVAVVYFFGISARIPEATVGTIAIFISMYTVGAWVDDRRRAMIVRVAIIVGMFVWLTVTTFQSAVDPDDNTLSREGILSPWLSFMLIQFLINIAFFGGAYYMGDRAYGAAMERRALTFRTLELERERERTAAQAVALDRVRIARELHDVVAHHVSAMGVQAGAARAVLDRDPDAARGALRQVEAEAREALTELRHLLETLRTSDAEADDPGDTLDGSILRLDALDDLVAHAAAHGLPTTIERIGDPRPVPETAQVNLYRITQEALTNARRHSGPGATAEVRVRYGQTDVEIEVTSTGRAPVEVRPGLGLLGMRERAAASGGTLEAGPRTRGGFLVRARIPLPASTAPETAPVPALTTDPREGTP
ncbi:sensor histidine kinase [Microbacterium sp. NPDC077184]|uniref:sensor histidine kinase n=1 Tax=Microbacterium sp. NPDC077184 TaxID=3154764 RepID=UPI003436A5C1